MESETRVSNTFEPLTEARGVDSEVKEMKPQEIDFGPFRAKGSRTSF